MSDADNEALIRQWINYGGGCEPSFAWHERIILLLRLLDEARVETAIAKSLIEVAKCQGLEEAAQIALEYRDEAEWKRKLKEKV